MEIIVTMHIKYCLTNKHITIIIIIKDTSHLVPMVEFTLMDSQTVEDGRDGRKALLILAEVVRPKTWHYQK